MVRALVNTRDDAGATGVTANDQEYLTVIPGMGIVSNVRGVLSASGHSPDVNSLGEVVYVRDVPNNTGQNIEQIFSTVRGQLTFINQFGFSSPEWPEIDNVGRTVFSMRAPNDIPNCQPSGCPAGTSENIWEIDTNGDLKQLTFFVFPEKRGAANTCGGDWRAGLRSKRRNEWRSCIACIGSRWGVVHITTYKVSGQQGTKSLNLYRWFN
jgi:hypothetical protein